MSRFAGIVHECSPRGNPVRATRRRRFGYANPAINSKLDHACFSTPRDHVAHDSASVPANAANTSVKSRDGLPNRGFSGFCMLVLFRMCASRSSSEEDIHLTVTLLGHVMRKPRTQNAWHLDSCPLYYDNPQPFATAYANGARANGGLPKTVKTRNR